jgi:hypothetical protein
MRVIEHAVDLWDLRGRDPRLNAKELVDYLQRFAAEGWELVWMEPRADLADQEGPCHVSVFKRVLDI